MRTSLALCTLLLLIGPGLPTAGQTPKQEKQPAAQPRLLWRLPGYSYLRYRRGGSRGDGLGTRLTAGFYSHEVQKKRAVRFSRFDLGDLLPMMALSLSGQSPKQGSTRKIGMQITDCIGAGTFSLRGRVQTHGVEDPTRIEQDGRFKIVGTEKAKAGPGKHDPHGAIRRPAGPRGAPGKRYIQEAVIEFERVVDAVAGRVLSFEGKITGTAVRTKGEEPKRFSHEETWRFESLIRPDSAGFRKLVNDAIESGQDWLSNHTRGSTGQKALILLTLCKNNPDRDTDAVQELLDDLRSSEPRQTYELAVAIQALESYYESPNESARIRRGEATAPSPRRLSKEDRALMTRWLERLLANRSQSGGNRWRFHYTSDPGFDNSNTQFAALGLQAAERCGLTVPKETWLGLAWHFLREALDGERKKTRLRLTSYRELARRKKQGKQSRVTSAGGKEIRIKGFNYHKAEPTSAGGRRMRIRPTRTQFAYGSMTCAGVTGLTVALGALRRRKQRDGRLLAKVQAARMQGFAWLHAHYEVRRNPGRGLTWYYYYLYSLERTCELGGIARIQDKRWYFDGAMQILSLQRPTGTFGTAATSRGPLIDTCFAILFLKRAIAPVTTR